MNLKTVLTICVSVCLSIFTAPAVAAPLDGVLEQLLRARDLRSTRYSICVIDVDTQEVLAEINADEPMIPASNMKLLTTASALDMLGTDFVFRTELGVTEPADGAKPDLVLNGDGDPALGDPVLLKEAGLDAEDLLDQWVEAVKKTGTRHFARLVVDDRVFDREMVHPDWPVGQLHKHYCAQVAGINFHDNCLHVLPSPAGQVGAAPRYTLYPESPFLEVFNSARTGKANEFWVDRKTGTNELTLRGRVKSSFYTPVRVTLNDPPIYLAQLLADRLGKAGIRIDVITRTPAGEQITVRPIHRVETLIPAVLRRTNQDSVNLFAEALIKRMGFQLTGSPGSWDNGAAAVRHALSQRLGTHATGANIADGSGMSRNNAVSARVFAELLVSMRHDPKVSDTFLASLSFKGKTDSESIAGEGTLDDRFKKLPAGHWVYGKSGYIRSVSTLSGYLIITDPNAPTDDDGRATPKHTIAFSLLFNGFTPPLSNRSMKSIQDKMVELIDAEVMR